MNDIIKIDTDEQGRQIVSGRDLHEFLEVGRDFTTWIKQMVGYGFVEHTDYEVFTDSGENPLGGRPKTDYVLTIDMAKEISMLQRTERGKQARQYFIECEKQLKKQAGTLDSYMIDDPVKRALRWAEEMKEQREQIAERDQKLLEQQPKVIFADAVSASNSTILVRDLAKILKQNGVDIGQNRLFDWLRNNGYLIKGGSDKNMPTQKAMELKLFQVKEHTHINGKGENVTKITTKVTGKGQIYFVSKFRAMVGREVSAGRS